MRLGDINDLGATALNNDMQKRVGWNFGNIDKLSVAQASAMLESIDNKISNFRHSKKLYESEKSTALSGLVLAKQVLESYISEKAAKPVNEISPDLAKRYTKNAKVDRDNTDHILQRDGSTNDWKANQELHRRNAKRTKGINRAAKRTSNESVQVKEAYSSIEHMVDQAFERMLGRLNAMTKMTRSDGALAKNIDSIGGDSAYLKDAQQAIDAAYDAIEDAHYEALGHIVDESAKQGMFEDEVGQAETLMAAQDMVDSIQGMLEDVGEMVNEKLPPLTDSIRRSGGADAAATFNQQTNDALSALMDAVRAARESMASAVGTLSGDAPTPMSSVDTDDASIDSDLDLDLEKPTDTDDIDLDDFTASDAAVGGDEPLGRAKRD